MSDALWSGQRFRTFNLIDDYNREALTIDVDRSLPAGRVVRALDRAAAWRGYPKKLRVDNGPELTSVRLADWADDKMLSWSSPSLVDPCKTGLLNGLIVLIGLKS